MDIPISTDKKKFYRQALTIVSNLPPFNKLRDKELEVFGWLSYYYNEYAYKMAKGSQEDQDQVTEAVNRQLFDYDTRLLIRENIEDKNGRELSSENLSNLLMGLKSKGFIQEKNGKKSLNTKYLFDPRRVDSITYKFHFNE